MRAKNWGATYNDGDHAGCIFFACEQACHEKDDDRDWNCCNGEVEFDVGVVDHHHDELNCEAKEEEEIKFEKGDVNLPLSVSSLSSVIAIALT